MSWLTQELEKNQKAKICKTNNKEYIIAETHIVFQKRKDLQVSFSEMFQKDPDSEVGRMGVKLYINIYLAGKSFRVCQLWFLSCENPVKVLMNQKVRDT